MKRVLLACGHTCWISWLSAFVGRRVECPYVGAAAQHWHKAFRAHAHRKEQEIVKVFEGGRIVTPGQVAVALVTAARAQDYDSIRQIIQDTPVELWFEVLFRLASLCSGILDGIEEELGILFDEFFQALALDEAVTGS